MCRALWSWLTQTRSVTIEYDCTSRALRHLGHMANRGGPLGHVAVFHKALFNKILLDDGGDMATGPRCQGRYNGARLSQIINPPLLAAAFAPSSMSCQRE